MTWGILNQSLNLISAVKAWSPKYWTARKLPETLLNLKKKKKNLLSEIFHTEKVGTSIQP